MILHFQASGLGDIRRWVLRYGSHAEVLAPANLRAAVAHEAQRMTKLYGGQGD